MVEADESFNWRSFARVDDALWAITNSHVARYDIATDQWVDVLSTPIGSIYEAQVTHDDDGKIYTATGKQLVIFDTRTHALAKKDIPRHSPYAAVDAPRLVWDGEARKLFITYRNYRQPSRCRSRSGRRPWRRAATATAMSSCEDSQQIWRLEESNGR